MKKHILLIILIFISAAISIFAVTFRFIETDRLREALSRDAINKRLDGAFSAINDFPGSAGNDIMFLHGLSSVQNLHNTDSRAMSKEVYDDFTNFLSGNSAYKDLFFYKKDFNCAMQVGANKKNDNKSCVTPSLFIADILQKAEPLSIGEVYISPIFQYSDITPDDVNIFALAYVTPANDNCSIISIINANYFLEDIRRLSREGEKIFLLDGDGDYLANPDRGKEKFNKTKGNFYSDFQEIQKGALLDESLKKFESGKKVFNFRRIYPTESNFAIYEGANKILGNEHKNKYFWVMASVSEKTAPAKLWQDASYLAAVLIIFLAHILIFAIKK